MHPVLSRNLFLVKEHVGLFKAANNFDVYDPETGRIVLECREEKLGIVTKILRFTDYKRMTPFHIEVRVPGGGIVVQVRRGVSLFLSKVQVLDGKGLLLGSFKQKLFSIGGAFDVLDPSDQVVCTLKGKWTGWDFSFAAGGTEYARVAKKWAGLGKELLTSADNYVLSITRSVPAESPARELILAAVLCIDMVLKE
ncbi:MAG TPA: phospholipid scramblase-related protein [Gemmatimonadaceae bacterium]|nr:phospholipid scramblase-related protein [Gemmatimonadaceae bacterium]